MSDIERFTERLQADGRLDSSGHFQIDLAWGSGNPSPSAGRRGHLQAAGAIVEDVRSRGELALRHHAERLGDIQPGQPLIYLPQQLDYNERRVQYQENSVFWVFSVFNHS